MCRFVDLLYDYENRVDEPAFRRLFRRFASNASFDARQTERTIDQTALSAQANKDGGMFWMPGAVNRKRASLFSPPQQALNVCNSFFRDIPFYCSLD